MSPEILRKIPEFAADEGWDYIDFAQWLGEHWIKKLEWQIGEVGSDRASRRGLIKARDLIRRDLERQWDNANERKKKEKKLQERMKVAY